MRGLLAALSLMAIRGDWTVGDTGVDHMYNDIINFQMKTNTTLECYNACADQDGCAGWVVVPTGNCGSVATCFLKSLMGNLTLNPCRISGVMPSALLPSAYTPVRVGQVQPEGWLSTELNIQANGLSGYLFYFWPDIQSSVWLGGDQDGGLHERGPYFLNVCKSASLRRRQLHLMELPAASSCLCYSVKIPESEAICLCFNLCRESCHWRSKPRMPI